MKPKINLPHMSKKLTISNAAKEIGISIETIRYYERTGLISQPKKPLSGYRIYNNEAISKLYFIKRAKLLGLSLNEISEIIKLGAGSCEETKELAMQKLENVKMKIDDLQAISKTFKIQAILMKKIGLSF